jgi:hypothetical protein
MFHLQLYGNSSGPSVSVERFPELDRIPVDKQMEPHVSGSWQDAVLSWNMEQPPNYLTLTFGTYGIKELFRKVP